MSLRSREEFLAAAQDGRRVHFQGRRVPDILAEPEILKAAERSAIAYDVQQDPELRALAVEEVGGEEFATMYRAPRSVEELRARSELIEACSARAGCTIVLQEVGTDALFALLGTLGGDSLGRAQAYFDHCRSGDLAVAVAQTDPKGDRSLPPHRQADPDLYLRVVDEDADHIVVRGAKCHTSFTPYSDEVLVLPTRAMGTADQDYALSFAVPLDTEGLEIYVSPYLAGARNSFEHPMSSRYSILESLTVFNDVVVPRERVFLCREPELAGPLALAFVNYHRYTAMSYKLPLVDLVVGTAHLVARANGISGAGHVREKLTQLIRWAETVRGLGQVAALRSTPDAAGVQVPDPLAVNMAKFEFAHGYHSAIGTLIDLAGGLVVTGPGAADWADPATRPVLEKYFAGAVPAEERLRLVNLVGDLTARDFGGYLSVMATHAEGSMEAEKLQLLRSYQPDRAIALARSMAQLDG